MIKKALRNHLLAVVASKLKRRTMSMFSGLLEEYVLQTDPCPAQKKNHPIIFSPSATLQNYKVIHTCYNFWACPSPHTVRHTTIDSLNYNESP